MHKSYVDFAGFGLFPRRWFPAQCGTKALLSLALRVARGTYECQDEKRTTRAINVRRIWESTFLRQRPGLASGRIVRRSANVPQGLKPGGICGFYGTAEAVPLTKRGRLQLAEGGLALHKTVPRR